MSPSAAPARNLLGASVATAIAFAILIALGMWQIERLHRKRALIGRIEAAEQSPPVPLAAKGIPPLFTRVQAQGRLRPGELALYGAEVRGMHMGAQAVELLDRPQAKPVLVVLGWVPTDTSLSHPVTGPVSVTGYVRLPESPGWLSASDDLEGRHFYTLNSTSIGAALGVADVAPFILVAVGPAAPAGLPQPAETLPRPANNHLQYALTWFALAASLLAVFFGYAFKRS